MIGIRAYLVHPPYSRPILALPSMLEARTFNVSQCSTLKTARIEFGTELPVRARIVNAVEVANGDVSPHIVIGAARLDQENVAARVSVQPIREQASGRTSSDNNIVKSLILHIQLRVENP